LLVVATGLGALMSFQALRAEPARYVSSTTLLVGDPVRRLRPGQADFGTAASLAETYAQLARGQVILESTIKALGLPLGWEELRRNVLVVFRSGQLTFEIRVAAGDPRAATLIATTIASQLIGLSPTSPNQRDQVNRTRFVNEELNVLQTKIDETKDELEKKRGALAKES
jgi:capsular polysaccharide biosynthesis protein